MDDLRWEDLTEWHMVTDMASTFRERFAPEVVAGVEPRLPIRFKVIREEWNELTEDGVPERLILEAEFV